MAEIGQHSGGSIAGVHVKPAEIHHVKNALRAGWQDFCSKPLLSGLFGLVYAAGGLAMLMILIHFGESWMIIPIAVGFPLIAPFIAAGLYDISRRVQKNESFSASDIFAVIWQQQRRELGWMAFVVLFIFWMWMYQVRLLLAVFLGKVSFSSLSSFDSFFTLITTTSDGISFILVGTMVGAFLSGVLFSTTVLAMPALLDRNIDFISAMILSFKSVHASPMVMFGWGAFIAIITFLAMLPAFMGLIITLPVFGHATWHLYKSLTYEADTKVAE